MSGWPGTVAPRGVWSGRVAANGPVSNAAGYFGVNALLSARLALLAQRGEAVMLAQPQLLARSGASATFLAGGELPMCPRTPMAETHGVQTYGVSRIDQRVDPTTLIK